jgi:hypothetical protein
MYLVEMVLESPRSSGAEAVIFTSRFERIAPGTPKPADSAAYSWAFLTSFVHMVQHQHWRSKDIVIVLSPEPSGTRGVEFWIERLNNIRESDELQYRHSFIIAALSIEIPPSPKFNILSVKPESALGTLPNLDLPNSIFRIAYQRDMRYLTWTPSELISFDRMPFLTTLAQNPLFSKVLTAERISEWNTMFSFMLNMALGEPTGDHSVISKYKIEAVTITASSSDRGVGTVKKMGEMLEGTLRSLNNLIEPLHQSFYYYIPLTPFTFVPIGHYMISFALLYVPCAVWVLLTIITASQDDLFASGKSFFSLLFVGIIAFILPPLLPNFLPIFEAFAPEPYRLLFTSNDEPQFIAHFYYGLISSLSVIIVCTNLVPTTKRRTVDGNGAASGNELEPQMKQFSADVQGSIALAPYLLFLAASALLNASFAMVAISVSLPGLVVTLLHRRIPRLIRILLSVLINPLFIIMAASQIFGYPPSNLVAKFVTNWEHHRGLTFPFVCLYIPTALQAFVMSLRAQ